MKYYKFPEISLILGIMTVLEFNSSVSKKQLKSVEKNEKDVFQYARLQKRGKRWFISYPQIEDFSTGVFSCKRNAINYFIDGGR